MAVINKSRWSHTTPFLWFCCLLFTWGDLLFGIDTGSFGSLQALPSFLNHFGETINGKKALSATRKAKMNSVVWAGKITGTIIFEPLVSQFGYKITMYLVCLIQAAGVVIELTAHHWIQFSIGRVIAYLAVGIVENAVTGYIAEISPVQVRGFFTGSLSFFVTGGNLWGAGMSRAFVAETHNRGWQIPTAVQLIPVLILFLGVPFVPESPRWLIAKGRKDDALKALNRLRPRHEIETGVTAAEVEAIDQAIEEAEVIGNGRWIDLFRGTYLRRSFIAMGLFCFQQSTGIQFINSYLPTFLKQLGLGTKAFTYTVVNLGVSMFAALAAMYLYDRVGRRPLEITGAAGQVIFMFLVGGLASAKHQSTAKINGVVASFVLFSVSARISHSSCCWIMTSELGGVKLRRKIMTWGTSWDVIFACVWTVSVPYMLVTLGARAPYVFGGIATLGLIFAVLCVPETAHRSLEEIDELFEMRLAAWNFKNAQTTGIGRRIAKLEAGVSVDSVSAAEREQSIGSQDEKVRF